MLEHFLTWFQITLTHRGFTDDVLLSSLRVLTNAAARPGQSLVLSKAIGTGIVMTADEIRYVVDNVPEDVVIRQDPEAGATAIVGDTVLIVVSMGPEPVQVPDLSDMTEGQAEDALSAVNLVLRVANSTQPVADARVAGGQE